LSSSIPNFSLVKMASGAGSLECSQDIEINFYSNSSPNDDLESMFIIVFS